ncbi:unnamed protein product [Chondrus crispus]|uniref:Uncharacterized protein n=1 Tax=Chondrus crispus TaxID=2769 RepID=R7Q4Y5_CHOCR|nr:unnamed protein product [Chondrus crispus]CDF33607.1 unnamed protein product [Chondrus crispus]|eukprot:XP_005713410.1 unnamed protein product [Chondrus crispus]
MASTLPPSTPTPCSPPSTRYVPRPPPPPPTTTLLVPTFVSQNSSVCLIAFTCLHLRHKQNKPTNKKKKKHTHTTPTPYPTPPSGPRATTWTSSWPRCRRCRSGRGPRTSCWTRRTGVSAPLAATWYSSGSTSACGLRSTRAPCRRA